MINHFKPLSLISSVSSLLESHCELDIVKSRVQNVQENLAKSKIKYLQIDPFSFCNAKCWFCPVKYHGNPKSEISTMPVDLLKKILDNIDDEKSRVDGLVDKDTFFAYTAHYNEVLLYKYFKEFCQEFSFRKMSQMILSNGMTLTPDKTDIILEYRESVAGICLNIPAFNSKDWSIRTGFPEKYFDKLVNNIEYATQKLFNIQHSMPISIQVNGIDRTSLHYLRLGKDAPSFDLDSDLQNQVATAKTLFPSVPVFAQNGLVDRNGLLPKTVLSNDFHIDRRRNQSKTGTVIGCSNTVGDGKGRPFDWLHVSATGKVILCCDDFEFNFIIGDLSKNTLREFWGSDHHVKTILSAFSTLCNQCSSAVFD